MWRPTVKYTNALLLAAVLCALPMTAQDQCAPTDTLARCWEKLGNPPVPVSPPPPNMSTAAAAEVKADATQKTVSVANAGVPALVTPTGSSLADFLTLLSATLQSSSFKSQGETLTFDYSPPFSMLDHDHSLKFEAVFAKPKLNDKVKDGLASNAAALKKFDDSLSNTDDATFSAAFEPTGQTFGRSITPHRQMFTWMQAALFSELPKINGGLLNAIVASGGIETSLISTLTADQAAAFQSAAVQQAVLTKTYGTFERAFTKLLNNQPQLFATAIFEARRNIVGPNELTGKVTYEMTGRNLNGFRRGAGAGCVGPSPKLDAAACAAALVDYANEQTLGDDRLALSAEYHHAGRRWIADTESNLAFGYPRVRSFVYNITYGRTMVGTMTTPNSGRIDLSVQYEDKRNAGDPTKDVRSRATGSITYTQKMSENMSFPISLVYANRASDLTNVDRKLNVHFGIVFKMPQMPGK